jgi:hypothetical protein
MGFITHYFLFLGGYIVIKFDTRVITWYEMDNQLEYHVDETIGGQRVVECSLEEAIQFAWENKMCLYIQTAYQDAGLFVDYTK